VNDTEDVESLTAQPVNLVKRNFSDRFLVPVRSYDEGWNVTFGGIAA